MNTDPAQDSWKGDPFPDDSQGGPGATPPHCFNISWNIDSRRAGFMTGICEFQYVSFSYIGTYPDTFPAVDAQIIVPDEKRAVLTDF
jgi:hypothetical protein